MFRQGVRRILKTPPAETTSAILESLLRPAPCCAVINISEQDINSFIKEPVIIQVKNHTLEHTVQYIYRVKRRCISGAKTKQAHPPMVCAGVCVCVCGAGVHLQGEFGFQKQ